MNKELSAKLRQLTENESELLEQKAPIDLDALEKQLSDDIARQIQPQSSIERSVCDLPEISDETIHAKWAAFAKHIEGNDQSSTKQAKSKCSRFAFRSYSYLAAAAVLALALANSPWFQQHPQSHSDSGQMVSKGSLPNTSLNELIDCTYDLVQGELGKETAVSITEKETPGLKPGNFQLALTCKAPSTFALRPIYAHIRYQIGNEVAYLSNIKIFLNNMQIVTNPSTPWASGKSFFVIESGTTHKLDVLLTQQKRPGDKPLERLSETMKDGESAELQGLDYVSTIIQAINE